MDWPGLTGSAYSLRLKANLVGKIFYVGFGQMIGSVQTGHKGNSAIEFIPITQLTSDIHVNTLKDADLYLIGPLTVNPLQQVQRAVQQSPHISIVVLAFQDQYQITRQTIQFGHHVGKNLTIIPYQFGKDITVVLENAINRTRQRKSFLKIQQRTIYPQAAGRDVTFQSLGVFLENAPIGAIVFDKDKKVISANSKAKQYFGIKLNLRKKTSWSDLFPDEDYAIRMNTGSEPIHEIIKVNNQFLEVNISPLMVDSDMPQYMLLVNDVTRIVDVENQLKSKIEELEFLNRELDEFVNVVSHDFKTPLTSIGLLTELALKEKTEEKVHNFLLQIKHNSKKLKEQLLGLTKLVDVKKSRSEKVELVNLKDSLNLILSEFNKTLEEIL
jgi:signal transduction histidine kinase